MTLFEKYSIDIDRLCKHHKVKKLYAFGSVLTDQFSQTSDIDLIVDFDNIDVIRYADNYFDFKFSLQDILKHPIDLLEEKAIKNPYLKKAISKKRQLVYGH
jgi:predicted nucleotidyltransferase